VFIDEGHTMFDPKRLLGQLISSQVQKKLGGGYGGGYGHGYGGGHHGGPLAGGLASLVLGSKGGRRLGGSAGKLGGMALIGSLAYRAYQSWQESQQQGQQQVPPAPPAGGGSFLGSASASPWSSQGASPTSFAPQTGRPAPVPQASAPVEAAPPVGSPFAPAGEDEQQALSRTLLRAMIAAAKADGQVDAAEQAAIFGEMDKLDLDADDKAFVIDELRAPLDIDAIARSARTPEEAAEIYTASLLAIDVDTAAERGYLALLAARLGLDDRLVAHLHATIEDAAKEA
jgi:uncharacterized membrane protein YebE (DUF533 family)